MRFAGRTVAVTGAGSGIGAAMASRFLGEGADVVGGDLDPSGIPAGCAAVEIDVADETSVARFVAMAIDTTGRLDVICNNAGIGSTTDAVDCTVEEWDRVFAVNARGVFLGTRAALPHMLERRSGVIVNTASVAGMVGLRDRASYCASKGAVIAFTRQVAIQYAGTGVRCNCLCPGTVDTPWVAGLLTRTDDPDGRRSDLIARQPVGRLGTADEIAAAAVYLASDDAEFVTGTSLVIDGGLTAG